MPNREHLKMLDEGVNAWNDWRKANPGIHPDLTESNLTLRKLEGVNFDAVDLSGTALRLAHLSRARFHKAKLIRADLTRADLSQAKLISVNLTGATLVDAVLSGATLADCTVYGVSAWGLNLDEVKSSNLRITPDWEAEVTVDDLEVAQFVYLMLNNNKIRNVLTTIGEKGVLILGRFTPQRKAVLDAVRERLRTLNYVPMIFDFEKADDLSFSETIKILAGMSKFIVADVTNPSSAPLELQAIIPDYMVPLIPIIEKGATPFSMLADLQQRDWVLPVQKYRDVAHLTKALEVGIIQPALRKHAQLRLRKAQAVQMEELPD